MDERIIPIEVKSGKTGTLKSLHSFINSHKSIFGLKISLDNFTKYDKIISVTNTGMAVTLDIGNTKDIHSKNKQDVGKRLALWALVKDYGYDNSTIQIHTLVFKNMFEAIDNNTQPLSNINNAYQHTICVNKCFEYEVKQINKKYLDELSVEKEMYNPDWDVSKEKNIVIKGVEEIIEKMYEQEKSFIEIGAEWAK